MQASLWQLLFLTCFIGIISVGSVAGSELEALMNLKEGFKNPANLSSWNSKSPCHGWLGVACAEGTVVNLTLSGLDFTGGSISASIGDLPNLQHIDLSDNGLIGQIPSEWSNLINLQTLILKGNMLNGSIPIGLIKAKNLSKIRLEGNELTGNIPPQIFDNNLEVLKYFAIEFNNISGPIPSEIGQCGSLRSFYAAHNQLNGSLPDSIGNLTKLVHFEVEGNNLSGRLPGSIGNLTKSLVSLNLSDNNFSGQIPTSLSSKFNASSFAGNPSLCGLPLLNCSLEAPAPAPSHLPPPVPSKIPLPPRPDIKSASNQKGKIIGGAVGGAVGASLLIFLLVILSQRLKKQAKDQAQVQNWFSPDIQANRRKGRFEMFYRSFQYSYEEIVSNAGYFDTAHVLGKGRFATVYKSFLPDGTNMAVKVFKFASVPQGFEKEVEMIGSVKHRNLLSIKGFYSNPVEKAVFYDYLPTGTLYDLLHGSKSAVQHKTQGAAAEGGGPDWPARHRIGMGVAQALAFLHRGCGYRILHRDLKSTNILLETDLLPRVSDFGLVHMVSGKPSSGGDVVETPGYTAPEVLTSKKYTEKSDVYSYGVVLLELITGKKAVSYIRERSVSLTEWVTRLHKEQRGREVMDPVALTTCPLPEYLDKALELAVLCVDENPNFRPTMAEVASILEGLCSTPSPLRSPDMMWNRPLLPS